jgi:hypothetical protein
MLCFVYLSDGGHTNDQKFLLCSSNEPKPKGDAMKKTMWTVAALLAVAAIPIYLASRKKAVVPVAGRSNDSMDWDKQPWE